MKLAATIAALTPMMTAASLSMAVGTVYIWDCRTSKGGDFNSCWLTGAGMMGIGAGAAGGAATGFRAGYNTYNPNLRRPDGNAHRIEES